MAAYGQTDYEKGVLYALEHDVPALLEVLERGIQSALNDINKGPSHFTDGRRYPLQQLQNAVDRTINALNEETREEK